MTIPFTIEVLMSVLRNSAMSGYAQAALPAGFIGTYDTSVVIIVLHQGRLTSCAIHSQERLLVQGMDVLTRIARLTLEWTVTETTLLPPNITIPPSASLSGITSFPVPQLINDSTTIEALIPVRHTETLAASALLTRNTRNVYALINGRNTISKIARLLSLSAESVYAELQQLQARQIISFASFFYIENG